MTTDSEINPLDERAWRANWMLATIWLGFAIFPLLSLWVWGDQSTVRQLGATALLVAFCVVYALGFRDTARREVFTSPGDAPSRASAIVLTTLAVLNVAAFLVGGWAMLGLLPFIVAFAVLNVSWRTALVVIASSLALVIGLPFSAGVFADLWPTTAAVATAAAATALGRLTEERSRERTTWQTELLLSDDRNRVARDVHDVLGHSLTAVVLKAELSQRLLEKLDPQDDADRAIVDRCRTELDELQSLSRRSLAEIRSTVGGLRNPSLADEVAAARTVLADAGVAYTSTGDSTLLPIQARGPLAWVVRESITNVVRHARASHCTVHLAPTPGVWLRIDDDGVGPAGLDEGNGLTGLRERLEPLGAGLSIGPVDSGGTRLEVRHG
jgi:two-component system sensor histidine kinase DesK